MGQDALLPEPLSPLLNANAYALGSFLSRYREPTLSAYRQDLRVFLGWADGHGLAPLDATRPHLELYLRWLEGRGYAPATISRRFSTLATFYKYAVIDGYLEHDPAKLVGRPKVPWESQRRTVLHPLEFAALLSTARQHSPTSHALVALLGMVGLRVSEACTTDVTDLRYEAGYELLSIMGKGRKPALVPLPIPVLRAVREAIGERTEGPILRSNTGTRLTRASASARLKRLAEASGIRHPISPHALRRTFCTTGLVTGVSVRDMQYAMRHADAKTTLRYDMARANLDRHAAHSIASYLAGLSVG